MDQVMSCTTVLDNDIVTQKTIVVSTGQESSIEIKEDTKGCPRLTVKVYHSDADFALDKAIELYENGQKRLERMA